MLDRFLINRQFARVWVSGAVSRVGDFVFDTTVLLWISTILAKGQPWAPAAASGVLIAVLVPSMVVGPLAGVFVDRWDPRRTMLWSDAIRALLIAVLAVLPFLPNGTLSLTVQLVIVYSVVVLSTIVSLFFTPARFTIVADIVPEADQPRAASITEATIAAASIIGPPLAAPLLFTAGVRWALILNALSFVFSFAMIWNVRDTQPRPEVLEERAGFWREFALGLRTIMHTQVVLTMVIMGMIANVAAQTFNALGVFFVVSNLHTDAKYFGLQETAMGIGALVGATATGWIAKRLGLARTVWMSMLLFGVLLGAYARMTSFAMALVVLLIAAIMLGAMNTPVGPLLMRSVPREVLGRVFATFAPVVQSVGIVGVAIAGWLSSSPLRGLDSSVAGLHFGTYDTILLGAGVIVVLSGLYGMVNLRDDQPTASPDDDPESETTVTA